MNIGIIGGGAAGMFISILIKREKPYWNVTIYERNDRVGKKLLVTGNGRCNYTNVVMDKANFHSSNIEFPMKILDRFNNQTTIEYLKTIGIYPRAEKDGRVFPLSLQGSSVLDLLRFEIERLGVELILKEKIDSAYKKKDKFILQGTAKYEADILIVATGGLAMPSSGSDGIGYRIGKSFGHNIIDQYPTIVQLESDYKNIKALKGVRVDTCASLYIDNRKVLTKCGDVLFTDYGLSGPAILDLSRSAIQALIKKQNVEIGVNLIGIDKSEIEAIIFQRAKNLSGIEADKFFIGIIHKKLIHPLLNMIQSKIDNKLIFISYDVKLLKAISNNLSDFRFNISGYKGFGNSQSTTGGIDTSELDPNSCESKLVDNLYFIGELVDVDGDCGGYNLQWAWSSAFVAGSNIITKGC